ncbi:hypothetical protein KI387_022896, partial [Taxus chinensis]
GTWEHERKNEGNLERQEGEMNSSSNSHMTIKDGVIKEDELVIKISKAMTLSSIPKNQLHKIFKTLLITRDECSVVVTSLDDRMHIFSHELDELWGLWTT